MLAICLHQSFLSYVGEYSYKAIRNCPTGSWFVCLKFFQERFFLLVGGDLVSRAFTGRVAVPAIITLDRWHAFTRRCVCKYHRRLFLYRARLVARVDELADVVPVHLDDVPVESAV